MRGLLLLGIAVLVYGDASFITKEEYASSLYHNPRGIGCHLCHGERGEGRRIATYHEKGIKKVFEGKPIDTIPFEQFSVRMGKPIVGMPHYYLTKGEIQILYYYLHHEEKKDPDATAKPKPAKKVP
ncbi:MAG: cytochrome c [Sulfuricurvum sp.]